MKILVTGGSGFIGSYLVQRLLEEKHEVSNLDLKTKEQGANFIQADIREYEKIKPAFAGIDTVFHLAAQTSVPKSVEDPLGDAELNVLGTLNVMRACAENNVNKVVYFSSASVYGNPAEVPIKETTLPGPIAPYGASKLCGEYYCNAFAKSYGFKAIIFRPFNVYGYGSLRTVIPEFINQIKKTNKLSIKGDGGQTRDFIYVEDIIEACVLALNADKEGVYNIASGKETSINELAKILAELMGVETEVEHIEAHKGDIQRSFADVSKAQDLLGFKAKHELRDGLKEMLEKYEK